MKKLVTPWVGFKGNRVIVNKNYAQPKRFFLFNNGQTTGLRINDNGVTNCNLRMDVIRDRNVYYFSHLHFHWGPNNSVGSEHKVNGKSYPLEMHLVHKTKNISAPPIETLAVFFRISVNDNVNLNPIIQNLKFVQGRPTNEGYLVPDATINLISLLPKKMKMMRYVGSMTAPPCTQNVQWTIFETPLTISARQMAEFRKVLQQDGQPLLRNARPVQKLNTRKVSSYLMLKKNANVVEKLVYFLRTVNAN